MVQFFRTGAFSRRFDDTLMLQLALLTWPQGVRGCQQKSVENTVENVCVR
jgi:hypothetical protein